jgi:hypothetical protein
MCLTHILLFSLSQHLIDDLPILLQQISIVFLISFIVLDLSAIEIEIDEFSLLFQLTELLRGLIGNLF